MLLNVLGSWQSGRFQHKRTRVRMQPSTIFVGKEHLFTVEKAKIKTIRRPGMAHFQMLYRIFLKIRC